MKNEHNNQGRKGKRQETRIRIDEHNGTYRIIEVGVQSGHVYKVYVDGMTSETEARGALAMALELYGV